MLFIIKKDSGSKNYLDLLDFVGNLVHVDAIVVRYLLIVTITTLKNVK